MSRGQGRIFVWLLIGYMVPPVVWLLFGVVFHVWSWSEMLRIILSPYIWIYILLFVGGLVLRVKRHLNRIYLFKQGESSISSVDREIRALPRLFLTVMFIYCILGPNAALLGQTLNNPFLDSYEYVIAELMAIPLILLFSVPFLILFIGEVENYCQVIPLTEDKFRFMTLRGKLTVSFIMNIFGAILTLLVVGMSIVYKTDSSEVVPVFIRSFLTAGSIVFLISLINMIIILKMIVSPVRSLSDTMLELFRRIDRGRGRLTLENTTIVRDEIGYLYARFERFLKSFTKLVSNVQQLGGESEKINENMLVELENGDRSVLDADKKSLSMSNRTDSLETGVKKIEDSTNISVDFFNSMDSYVKDQVLIFSQLSSSAEDISRNIEVTIERFNGLQKIFEKLEELATDSEQSMLSTINKVDRLSESAKVIKTTTTLIEDVAERTNLLAMNASIEAAHAGVAGKGFAVVAGEIRKLAEATKKSSGEINNSLQDIELSIAETGEASRITDDNLNTMLKEIKNMVNRSSDLKEFFLTTNSQVSQVNSGMDELDRNMTKISMGSEDVKSNLQQVMTVVEEFTTSFTHSRHDLHSTVKALSHVRETIDRIKTLAIDSNQDIRGLVSMIKDFEA